MASCRVWSSGDDAMAGAARSLADFGIDPLTLDAGENERLGDLMEDNDRLAVEVRPLCSTGGRAPDQATRSCIAFATLARAM